MIKRYDAIRSLNLRFPGLENHIKFDVNKDIFLFYRMFVDDPDFLICALIQNPYGPTKIGKIKTAFGDVVAENIKILNRLHGFDKSILRSYVRYEKIIILFLLNFKFIFEDKKNRMTKKVFNGKKVRYAMKLLEETRISQVKNNLEDLFFSFLKPEIYDHYSSLLNLTKSIYLNREREIKKKFEKILEKEMIKVKTETRLKSVCSIHKKIIKKNILLSQVLDVIGLRLIVENEAECYKVMGIILAHYPVILNKIKDYIAIPKENGYESIHLTILHGNYPLEIQIRTEEMHAIAQYGKASHYNYKKYESRRKPIAA